MTVNDGFTIPAPKTAVRKTWLFWLAMCFLFLPGLVHAYLLMPFPGSQNLEAIKLCYYLEKIIWPLRIVGAVAIIVYAFYFGAEKRSKKIMLPVIFFAGAATFYVTDIQFKAEEMFKEPVAPAFANVFKNKVPQDYLVVGVVHNGVAKAYPIIYLGYHHKIQDEVGGLPVLVTYCTMCRTGRVFSPVVNGKRENFRLVGARHYNAVIEDGTTGSWWYQATGEAAAGSREGEKLAEVPYQQATLAAWLERYPSSLVLQPEEQFKPDYADLKKYDVTQPLDRDSNIVNKDTLVRKSWILGINLNGQAKAYDWRQLVKAKVFNDVVGKTPLLVTIKKDKQTFQAWNTVVDGKQLHFKTGTADQLTDVETNSLWDNNGLCVSGVNKGKQLTSIQSYQEYWHSWKNFHPKTSYLATLN
ncbi:DUF3179 domain-containing (seleno)protein [Mucilaginibacter conchicola]|nr:DUF3179 domain-containing (seleno)protein [Mucilaginibacter conchicola]